MTSILLGSYRAPKTAEQRTSRSHSDVYTARLRGESIYFGGGAHGAHKIPATLPIADINAHWFGYIRNQQSNERACPKAITKKVLIKAQAQATIEKENQSS